MSLALNSCAMTELKPTFDQHMYPEGVNHNFLTQSAEELAETFGNSNGKGKFEDPETRDIAKNKQRVVELLKQQCGLKAGSVIADVGAGESLPWHVEAQHLKSVSQGPGCLSQILQVWLRHLGKCSHWTSAQGL